jgi:hypothetical protein
MGKLIQMSMLSAHILSFRKGVLLSQESRPVYLILFYGLFGIQLV